ncbi:hypothetical protein FCMLKIFP_00040 [Pseudomonas phage Ka3]|uniref:Uncharacterized protein n=2 Tax=Luzseptimavirus KPP21 TaxID=1982595 RepID=A0A7S5W997_9CAUD|nr:hypothetical protein AVU12_gp020 [Pseudomonas phage KPP21]QKE55984.1 hypothetical protein AMP2_gp036 [Pseudomonas phage vB_Pae_AM.P2]QWY17723.1 hypothetical protein [Pseudomonas phage vB_Pae-PA152]UGL60874.1 hypothetical protein [Pseudomonas phage vB_PaeS_TUMS_P6]UNI71956.1 hypothetical protein [Pseudomonas phage vB_PaeP_TUMS_P10]WQZ52390.1 hypothetical protein FCMLKIFP_00040 [Pseudomonas phage Ka3]
MSGIWLYQIKAAVGYCYGRVLEKKHLKEFGYAEPNDYTSEYVQVLSMHASESLWKEAYKHLRN